MSSRRGLLGSLFLLAFVGACTLVGVPPRTPPPADGGGEAGAGAPDARPGGTDEAAGARPGEAGGADRGGSEAANGEVRALWVVRTTLAHPDSARAMVRRAHRAGFNTLLVQVRGRADAYYDSRREPAAAALADAPGGYDPLALVLREAHDRGLAVHAWVNAHLVNGVGSLPDDPRHLVRARPELLAVPRALATELRRVDPRDPSYARALLEYARERRGQLEGLYTSPAHPEVKEHLRAVVTDLVERYDVDGLHLDYVRYPSPDFDYSPVALERFRLWTAPRLPASRVAELDRARIRDPLAWPDALPEAWDDFRRAQITDLVRTTYHGVKERRPDLVVSAAVRPDPYEARRDRFQDWARWLEEGILDAAAPMAYTESESLFRSWLDGAVRRAGPDRIWAGIGLYKTDLRGTLEQVGIARRRGVRGVAIFSYDWAVGRAPAERAGAPFLDRLGQEVFGGAVGAR